MTETLATGALYVRIRDALNPTLPVVGATVMTSQSGIGPFRTWYNRGYTNGSGALVIPNLLEGTHLVAASKTGYSIARASAVVYGGRTTNVDMTMTRVLSAEMVIGDIYITSTPPDACVYIDNNVVLDNTGNTARTPIQIVGVPEGIHNIEISLDGYECGKVSIDVMPNQVNNVNIVLTPL